jgi:hypothetical protein
MSPEQAAGRTVDHRADLYAIGVILFECATGRKPFLAEALFDLLRMHVEMPPPSPRALRPDMPPELEHVILTALAKPPDQRFATATAMSLALQHATQQLPPDQWRPLTPPASQPSTGSWAPTPPSSWSGQGSRPPPPPVGPPPIGNVSTVSAGQVTRGAKPRSSKKMWIALAVMAVVGGGITAAAVLGSGNGGGDPGHVAAGPGAPGSAGPAAGSSGGSPGAGSADPAKAKDPWAAPHPEAEAHADDPAAQAIDDAINALPPDQQKRLAAYKGLAKLPPKERAKRLRELTKQGMAGLDAVDPAAVVAAAAGDDDDTAEAPEAPAPTNPAPTRGAAKASWITNETIDPPPNYDPEHLDVAAFIPWAIARARQTIPDAQLIRIDTNGVSPDGRANLKLATLASEHGDIDIRFISPSRGKRDPKQPLGVARHDFKCEFRIIASPEGVELMPIDFADCSKEHVVPPPRCGFAAVWKKAIARKAPSQNVVGNVDYRSNGTKAVWYFDIGFGFDVAFSQIISDDC